MSWTSDIDKASKLLDIAVPTMVRLMSFHIYYGVISRTPVDHGYLRAAWNMSLNASVFIETPGQKGSGSLPRDLGRFPQVHITNGLPYAGVVEYGLYPGLGPKTKTGSNPNTGGGIFSSQAPVGMVEVTLVDMKMNLRSIVGN